METVRQAEQIGGAASRDLLERRVHEQQASLAVLRVDEVGGVLAHRAQQGIGARERGFGVFEGLKRDEIRGPIHLLLVLAALIALLQSGDADERSRRAWERYNNHFTASHFQQRLLEALQA